MRSPSPSRNGKQQKSPPETPIIAETKSEVKEEVTEAPREDEKTQVVEEKIVASESKSESATAVPSGEKDPSFTSVFDIEPPFKECAALINSPNIMLYCIIFYE